MDNERKIEVADELFDRVYRGEHRENVQRLVANIKADLENIPGVESFVISRIKAPLSILQKYDTEEKYSVGWNSMKDLLGFMVVVDSNQDVDEVLYYMDTNYRGMKNPNSSQLYRDFRKKPIRELDPSRPKIFDQPSPKGYQINDGYKNVRINMMINPDDVNQADGYPIEIQVKTKEQYIAHMATHDPVYKAKSISDSSEAHRVSDALFPYFEAVAHLKLERDKMKPAEIERCKADIKAIFERNKDIYEQYPDVFNEACSIFAVYTFVVKNKERLYADEFLDDSVVNNQLLESEILRIFYYKQKGMLTADKSLTDSKSYMKAAEEIINMSYDEFVKLSTELAGSYRKEKCIISGIFDMIREKDIKLIQRCAKSFRKVIVSVYDDELVKIFLGVDPMYSVEDRMKALEMLDDVAIVSKVDLSGIVSYKDNVEPFIIEEPQGKKYKIGYLPGVFDMFHPGHIEYITQALELCDKLIIGIKTDEYSMIHKNKTPIQNQQERLCIANALVGIEEVCLTGRDILPPIDVLEELDAAAKAGDKVAIFLGSDWMIEEKRKKKSPLSLAEHVFLTKEYPDIVLDSIPRGESGRSSTGYRKRGNDAAKFINPHELKTLGVQ
ncbi:MAG: adenylyltransferase/cytidyltransferase family protein [Clostridia bacterium]|nr:adenylyltransferase/cytidyltransferase family protein [Clostridia bacterium]